MKLTSYLRDQVLLILFYFTAMTFMTAFLYLEPFIRLRISSLIYLHAVLLFLFLIFLLLDFLRKRRDFSALKQAASNSSGERLVSFSRPKTREGAAFYRLLRQADVDHRQRIRILQREIRENKDFIMSWVHEVKTPIAAGRMLISESDGEAKELLLDKLEDELERIDHYVEQALYYSRSDSFSNDYFISDYRLQTIVNASLKKHARLFIAKRIRVRTSGLQLQVLTDKKWLQFVVDQILSNSLKYTSSGGEITITGKRVKQGSCLVLADNGCGIRPEDTGRVFSRGFTGFTGRKKRHSTGMGLYLSRVLTEKLGHRISLSSEYGKGTTVTLFFPDHVDYTAIGRSEIER